MAEVTGTDVLRNALQARARKHNISYIAKDLGVGVSELESFASGRHKLEPVVMKALCRFLFEGAAEFDPASDRLKPVVKEPPRPLGNRPDPVLPSNKAYPIGSPPVGPQPVTPKPDVKKAARPGWSE